MILYIQQELDGIIIAEEANKKRKMSQSALSYLKQLCLCYGCSMEGRRDAIKAVCKISQKVPILVSDRNKDLFFPTSAIRYPSCVWINHHAVKRIKGDQHKTLFLFCDGSFLSMPIDIRGIRREMNICKTYLAHLEQQHVI